MTAKSLDSVWVRSAISHGMFRPKSFLYWGDRGEGAAGGTVRTGRIPDIDKQPRAAVYRQSRIPAIPTEPRVDSGLTAFSKRTWLVSAQDDFVWAGADETVSLSDPQRVILFLARSPSFEIMTDNPGNPRPRVLSGMRPTGKLHLGHYVGALSNWVSMQQQYDCFFFVADWHALTTDYADTSRVKQSCVEIAIDWLAAGLDPEKCTLFIQSHVKQHAELHLLFSMTTPLGWLERVPSYKDQRENIKDKDLSTYGFLGYPLLQSADILIYKGNFVPVGEDQVPHVELTREIARRFNSFYPKTSDSTPSDLVFPEPQPLLTPSPKLPGTDGRKMSKSYGNAILLSDPEAVVRKKLKPMVTDPAPVRRTDPGNPDKCPVVSMHKIFSDQQTIKNVYAGCTTAEIGCIECKGWAADSIVKLLAPMQERRAKFEQEPKLAWDILEAGSARAQKTAEATMLEVREAMHLSPEYEPPISGEGE